MDKIVLVLFILLVIVGLSYHSNRIVNVHICEDESLMTTHVSLEPPPREINLGTCRVIEAKHSQYLDFRKTIYGESDN